MGWFWGWLVAALLATWFDWKTTQDAFKRGAKEANPIARWLADKLGWKGKLVLDLTLVAGFACLALFVAGWQMGVIVLMVFTLVQGAIGIRNQSVGK